MSLNTVPLRKPNRVWLSNLTFDGFRTIQNPDTMSGFRMASLDRFVNKGHKKYFIQNGIG
jgi:hypothetical protein